MKSRNKEIGCYEVRIAMKFDGHLDSADREVPVNFQSDWNNLNLNLGAPRLHEIWR